jgi:lipopolysaccharide heptosyltransferase II
VDLARALVLRGHQAFVISNGGSLVKDLEAAGVRHIQLPVHKKSLFAVLANIPKVAKVLQEEKIDIVHARSRVPAIISFLACRRIPAVRFVTTCHGYYSHNFFSRIMGWGRYVIVSSNAIAKHMVEDFAVPEGRVRLIPRGVDLEQFRFSQKRQDVSASSSGYRTGRAQNTTRFTVGVIGRLTPIKGHKYFLLALAKLRRTLPRIRGLIVGDASPGKEGYKEELKMLTRRLSLDRYVDFVGRESDVPGILSRLDILVLPTITQEAFGRVIIEAGATGVPVIATRVGGVLDIIQDGVNGILVDPKDPADLASAMMKLFNDPELAQRLVLAARKNVEEKFSLGQMVEKTINVYVEAQTKSKILVIKLGALGDIILAGPSLRALREKFPRAHISVLVKQAYRPILENCPYINEVLELPSSGKKYYEDIWHISSLLRKTGFDMVVDLQNSRKSHILAYLSACNRRYGYDNGKFSFLLNKKVSSLKQPLSPVKHQARTLALLGIESVRDDLELWPDRNDEIWADDFFKEHKKDEAVPLIGINLGASPQWPSKRWNVEKFAALLGKIQDARMRVVFTGKGADKGLLKSLKQLCPNYFIDAVDKTSFTQLACIIKRCDVYISSDSAPLHIAYAVKTPVVALFGPTDWRRHTMENVRQVVVKKEVSCGPCYKRQCRKHTCMEEIAVEEVFAAIKKLL